MKKWSFIIFTLTLTMLPLHAVKAQTPDRVGLFVGYGGSYVKSNDERAIYAPQNSYNAFIGGFLIQWDWSRWMSLQAEPGWTHRGNKGSSLFTEQYQGLQNRRTTVKMQYLTLPVLIRIHPHWGVAPFVEAGPRLDLLLSRSIKGNNPIAHQVFNDYHRVTFGMTTGIGVETGRLGPLPLHLSGGIRVHWDLINSYKDQNYWVRNNAADAWFGVTVNW